MVDSCELVYCATTTLLLSCCHLWAVNASWLACSSTRMGLPHDMWSRLAIHMNLCVCVPFGHVRIYACAWGPGSHIVSFSTGFSCSPCDYSAFCGLEVVILATQYLRVPSLIGWLFITTFLDTICLIPSLPPFAPTPYHSLVPFPARSSPYLLHPRHTNYLYLVVVPQSHF